MFSHSAFQPTTIQIALEPVCNALNSLSLLNEVERLSGLNTWVTRTAAALTPEQRHTHRLVFEGLRDALTPRRNEPNFPSYLHNMTELNPFILRKKILEPLCGRFSRLVSYATPDTERLLNDVQAYLHCFKHVQGETLFDAALQTEVHSLLQDPPTLQQMMLSHLETMWQTTFAAEWRRVQSSLRWQVEMFTRSMDAETSLEETFHTFTGRRLPLDLPGLADDIAEVILIPSWHTGRHVTTWDWADWDGEGINLGKREILRLFFSEPPNYDVALLHSVTMGRAELRAKLNALTDETRMRIIDLLVEQDELPAQDIITALDLSQSSVSRHLKQLVGAGYLYERRGEGANKTYRLSSFHFDRIANALKQLVAGETVLTNQLAQDELSPYPQELRRFIDRSGRLTMWPPAKQRDKLVILEYLASKFEPGQHYTEKEVNERLLLHSTVKDAAALRRALYEYRFMNRERDGSLYWLIGTGTEEKEAEESI